MDLTYTRICPKCKSTEVTQRGAISSKAYSNAYVCLTCGFQGPIFPEIETAEANKLPKQKKNFMPSRLPIMSDGARVFLTFKEYKWYLLAVILLIGFVLIVSLSF